MVVMTVITIVSSFAFVRFDRAKNFQQRENVAVQLKSQLERARTDAIKRRATAISRLSSVTINQTSFSVQIDSNQNGVLDANESQNFVFDSSVSGQFVGDLNFPVTISFDHRGRAKTIDNNNNNVNSVFTLCNENCVSSNNNLFLTKSNSSVISVSPTGTVTVKAGDVSTAWTRDGFTITAHSTAAPAGLPTVADPTDGVNMAMTMQNPN